MLYDAEGFRTLPISWGVDRNHRINSQRQYRMNLLATQQVAGLRAMETRCSETGLRNLHRLTRHHCVCHIGRMLWLRTSPLRNPFSCGWSWRCRFGTWPGYMSRPFGLPGDEWISEGWSKGLQNLDQIYVACRQCGGLDLWICHSVCHWLNAGLLLRLPYTRNWPNLELDPYWFSGDDPERSNVSNWFRCCCSSGWRVRKRTS